MKTLTEDDYERAAAALGCDIPAIKAVCEVEAPHGGFLSNGEPVILFEAHIFDMLTRGQYRAAHSAISSATWNPTLYETGASADIRGQKEQADLRRAVALNREAALQSASWGKFQIMRFNWQLTGVKSLQEFINDMYRNEGAHLDAFVSFVKASKLDDALRDHRWMDFARGYNGAGFAANKYDQKLAAAYLKYCQ